eukprot:6068706-Amphidinium_carterae.1
MPLCSLIGCMGCVQGNLGGFLSTVSMGVYTLALMVTSTNVCGEVILAGCCVAIGARSCAKRVLQRHQSCSLARLPWH